MGTWKVIRFFPKNIPEYVELYNLEKDQAEKINLIEQNPGKLDELRRIMRSEHSESKFYPFP